MGAKQSKPWKGFQGACHPPPLCLKHLFDNQWRMSIKAKRLTPPPGMRIIFDAKCRDTDDLAALCHGLGLRDGVDQVVCTLYQCLHPSDSHDTYLHIAFKEWIHKGCIGLVGKAVCLAAEKL